MVKKENTVAKRKTRKPTVAEGSRAKFPRHSVVKALRIPKAMSSLVAGSKTLAGRRVTVNQSQLDRQKPNLRRFAQTIE